MKIFNLYFSRPEAPELVQVEFSSDGKKILRTLRGQTVLDTSHDGTFNWSGAVRALAILIVRAKTCSIDPSALASRVLSGERGSPATSLDYALSKEPNWLLDMFGLDSKGSSLTKRLFRRVNSGGKRPGPVSVALNERSLDCNQISIFLDGEKLVDIKDFIRLEENLVAQSGRTGLAASVEENSSDSVSSRQLTAAHDYVYQDRSKKPHWVILGGGRIGRGFLNVIAEELGFTTTLVVAGKNTPHHLADAFNSSKKLNKGYEVRTNGPEKSQCEIVRLSNYQFQLAYRSESVVESISESRTKIVSTSVGIERIPDIAPLIAEGIRLRLERSPDSPIVILVCENGRFPDGRSARETLESSVLECLSQHLHAEVERLVCFPETVLDCPIPTIPKNPSLPVERGWGQLLVERSEVVENLFSGSKYVELVDDLRSIQLLKLYSFNSLHCYVSVIGSLVGYHYVHEVVRDTKLRVLVEALAKGLAQAIIAKMNENSAEVATSEEEIRSYCLRSVERLAVCSDGYQDPVNRIVRRLLDGSYLNDGRLDGPMLSLELDQNPSICPELLRMLSLTLYFIVKVQEGSPNLLHSSALQFDKLSALPEMQDLLKRGHSEAKIRRSVLQNGSLKHKSIAFDVIADDLAYLDEVLHRNNTGRFEIAQLLEFFNRSMTVAKSASPSSTERFDLRCVVFDLDEGLINSESLLYRVTRQMIEEFGTASKLSFSHDDYASFVGMSEKEFFAREAVPRFQFSLTDPEELIKIREQRYLELLSNTDCESLCKPGFRATLALLRRCGVRLALYSNASRRRVDYTLNHIELRNYFDIVVSSSDVGMEDKPSPQMLEFIFEQLGVMSAQCLVIESSQIGIEAAKAAGCYCLAMENNYYPRRQTTIRRSGIEFLGNGWQLFEWIKILISKSENVGDVTSVGSIERSERLKDIIESRFL